MAILTTMGAGAVPAQGQSNLDPTQTALARDVRALQLTRTAIRATQQALVVTQTAQPRVVAPPQPIMSFETTTYIFVVGEDGLLYYKTFKNNDTWSDWQSMQPPAVGVTTDAPAVVASLGRIDLFVRGKDNAAWHRFFDGKEWSSWRSLGGKLTSGIGAAGE